MHVPLSSPENDPRHLARQLFETANLLGAQRSVRPAMMQQAPFNTMVFSLLAPMVVGLFSCTKGRTITQSEASGSSTEVLKGDNLGGTPHPVTAI